jgi:hypothetical protein
MPVALIGGAGAVRAATNPGGPECALIVPAEPLSAEGLASPYRLVDAGRGHGNCDQSDPHQAAFVQATVIDPDVGQLFVYNPLVVSGDAEPAVAPVPPLLTPRSVVGIWIGFNGDSLELRGSPQALQSGRCVSGLDRSVFGQFAYCNADGFFLAANQAIGEGRLTVPPLGTARDGKPCPTTRSFGVAGDNPSSGVTTTYLKSADGRMAQDTAANRVAFGAQAPVLFNDGDNLLLSGFVDPALGCTPYTAPDLGDQGRLTTSVALNELQAAANESAPAALVPTNSPMTLVGGGASLGKANLYRAGVNQPRLRAGAGTARQYCTNLSDIGQRTVQRDRNLTSRVVSPDPAIAPNLFTFLAQRLHGTFDNLGCGALLRQRNPVRLTMREGVVVDARFARPASAVPAPEEPAGDGTTGQRPEPEPAK